MGTGDIDNHMVWQDMRDRITAKVGYGAREPGLRRVSHHQAILYGASVLDGQVYNGGFQQAYYQGGWAAEMAAEWYEAIGATLTAAIVRRALQIAPFALGDERDLADDEADALAALNGPFDQTTLGSGGAPAAENLGALGGAYIRCNPALFPNLQLIPAHRPHCRLMGQPRPFPLAIPRSG